MPSALEYLQRRPKIHGIPLLSENVMDRYWKSTLFPTSRPSTSYADVLKNLFSETDYDELRKESHPQYVHTWYRRSYNALRISWFDLPDNLSPVEFVNKAISLFSEVQTDLRVLHEQEMAIRANNLDGVEHYADSQCLVMWDTAGFYAAFEHYAARHCWSTAQRDTFWSTWLHSSFPPDLSELPFSDCPTPYRHDQLAWIRYASDRRVTLEQLHRIGGLLSEYPELLDETDRRWRNTITFFTSNQPFFQSLYARISNPDLTFEDTKQLSEQIHELTRTLCSLFRTSIAYPVLVLLKGYASSSDTVSLDVSNVLDQILLVAYPQYSDLHNGISDFECFSTRSLLDNDDAFQYMNSHVSSKKLIMHPLGIINYWIPLFRDFSHVVSKTNVHIMSAVAHKIWNNDLTDVSALDFFQTLSSSFVDWKARVLNNTRKDHNLIVDWYILMHGVYLGIFNLGEQKEKVLSIMRKYVNARDKSLTSVPLYSWIFDPTEKVPNNTLANDRYSNRHNVYWHIFLERAFGPELSLLPEITSYEELEDYFSRVLSIFDFSEHVEMSNLIPLELP